MRRAASSFAATAAALTAALTILLLPHEGAARTGGPTVFEAVSGPASFALPVLVEQRQPVVTVTSPAYGSTIAGSSVTVTGTLSDRATFPLDAPPTPAYGEILWQVSAWSTGELLGEGSAPVVDGRFTIPDLPLGEGSNVVEILAMDAGGIFVDDTVVLNLTSDPDAPPVALVSPPDGGAVLTASVALTLNFSEATTLVAVNGAPDGRVLGPGLVPDALTLPLALGANVFTLSLEGSSGPFSLSFTLFRVESLEPPRITSIEDGAFTNQPLLTVAGTVPLGTPYVEVNGVRADVQGATFSASIPLQEGENAVSATAYPQASTTRIDVTLDTRPPNLLSLLPEDGTHTLDAEVFIGAVLDEAAQVSVTGPSGGVTGRTRAQLLGGFPVSQSLHLADLDPLPLVEGANDLVLTATDAAGNSTQVPLQITRTGAALVLSSPPDGSEVPALRVSPVVEALADVMLDALYVGPVRIPAFEGASLGAGLVTLPDLPLAPGPNEIRVVYHRDGGSQEVVRFAYVSTATGAMTVTGEVRDQATGAPVAGTLVSIEVNGLALVAVTGPDGRYSVAVEPGNAVVVAMAEGYTTETAAGSGTAGETVVADLELDATGLPGLVNEVAILVPPEGTVTDFEQLTVVGTVRNPLSSVTVNGIAAEVVGNRFTARHVPLSMGANQISASATSLGALPATASVAVERSDEPVLAVKLFSPPAGATIPGSGLVVRGFVSASDARTLVSGGLVPVVEGVFELPGVFVPLGSDRVSVVSRTRDELQSAQTSVPVEVASEAAAILLSAQPRIGPVPLETTLALALGVPIPNVVRVDFDTDGDGVLDVIDSATSSIAVTVPEARPVAATAYVTTAEGVELSGTVPVNAYLPAAELSAFAAGNPVDLAPAPGGDVYVLDASAGTVSRYTLDGEPVLEFGSPGVGIENLLQPQALAVDASGNIYVADTGNERVQVFSAGGTHVRSIGSSGSGELASPRGVEVSGDRLIVSDEGSSRLQLFSLEGSPLGSVPIEAPRGLADSSSDGVLVASPSRGLRALVEGSVAALVPFRRITPEEAPAAPVDVALGDMIAVADAGRGTVDVFSSDGVLMRRLGPFHPPPVAVLPTGRREVPTVLIADGVRVREVALPIPSPIPVVQELKSRLAASDIEGALELVSPVRRALFREMYTDVQEHLAADAAAMQSFSVDRLDEESAVVRIHTLEDDGGALVPRSYPVRLGRAEDGTWQIYDY